MNGWRRPVVEPEVTDLIPLIYDAAENPVLWPAVIDQTTKALHAVVGGFTIEDLKQGTSNITVAPGLEAGCLRLYNEHYESVNIHLRKARPLFIPGAVVASHQLCSDAETMSTEYYQDFLRPREDSWFHVLGGCVALDGSLQSVLSFLRGRAAGHFTERELCILRTLMPHMERAVRLHGMFMQYRGVADCFERHPQAAFCADGRGRVQFANSLARAIFDRNDGIAIDRNGTLKCADRRLADAIAEVTKTAGGEGISAGAAIEIHRANGRPPYTVFVSPGRQPELFFPNKPAGAFVFISDSDVRGEPLKAVLSKIYGLTPAEGGLTVLLSEGHDLSSCCEQLGIRRATGRAHLRNINGKLGIRRQAELVALVLKAAAAMPGEQVER
ncbi:MAG: helix-turn-helix transcriptional regulator [Acidobacteriota bacterium]|nr:helix-turn-helix transcriptional regulator [Acidobacteriota bacterium]